ncbi:hypothetical protein DXG01_016575, partial [Tephrocybe rancida]
GEGEGEQGSDIEVDEAFDLGTAPTAPAIDAGSMTSLASKAHHQQFIEVEDSSEDEELKKNGTSPPKPLDLKAGSAVLDPRFYIDRLLSSTVFQTQL